MTNVSTLLLGLGGGVELIDSQTFTANGTWSKPAAADPDDMAEIIVWGAGGFANGSGNARAGGGACNRQFVRVRDLEATVAVVVAAATTTLAPGGTSSFGKIKAYGGGHCDTNGTGGSGGGILSAGDGGIATSPVKGGAPGGAWTNGSTSWTPVGENGGGCGGVTDGLQHAENGGAGAGGDAIWGGGGGDGKSVFGGDGATSGSDAQAPGGGGRASATASRRNGARGEVRVKIWRGI